MFTALTKDNKRISIDEAIQDENYYCPVCGNPVVIKAKNSDNVRTHFAHKRNSLCLDDWKHDMSDWHFEWQSKFPIENREVVVEKDGVVHRADILINDTVIEFQHSSISGEEFEARNSFYTRCGYTVVWLFDATDKMKIDDCGYLVWRYKTKLFSNARTPITIYIQNYLPDRKDLLLLNELDDKEVRFRKTISPIMRENFLKEYGAIQDEDVLSVQTIIKITQDKVNQSKINEQRRVFCFPVYQPSRRSNRRYRRF